MKWLITGLNGTLAPKLAEVARRSGVEVLAWDRNRLPPEDLSAGIAWLHSEQPDAIAHLSLGSSAWAALLAGYAALQQKPFVYTSTAMVFDHQPNGPHGPTDARTAQDVYGRSIIRCEDAVLQANPHATVVRLGWQIDPAARGNNMLVALDAWQAERQKVCASRLWITACSFMDDTVQALAGLLRHPMPGLVGGPLGAPALSSRLNLRV